MYHTTVRYRTGSQSTTVPYRYRYRYWYTTSEYEVLSNFVTVPVQYSCRYRPVLAPLPTGTGTAVEIVYRYYEY
jgi:hypothetical protein